MQIPLLKEYLLLMAVAGETSFIYACWMVVSTAQLNLHFR